MKKIQDDRFDFLVGSSTSEMTTVTTTKTTTISSTIAHNKPWLPVASDHPPSLETKISHIFHYNIYPSQFRSLHSLVSFAFETYNYSGYSTLAHSL
jgi:hypothetical protein